MKKEERKKKIYRGYSQFKLADFKSDLKKLQKFYKYLQKFWKCFYNGVGSPKDVYGGPYLLY